MVFHARKYGFFLLAFSWQLAPVAAFAGQAHQSLSAGTAANVGTGVQSQPAAKDLDITIQGPNGTRVEETAMVTLLKGTGQLYRQATTSAGFIRFKDVARAQYTIQVVSASYQMAVKPLDAKDKSAIEMTVELEPAGRPDESAAAVQQAALSHQAQKELGKATEALRVNAPGKARGHLEAAYRLAPDDAEVNYLFGVYSSQVNEWEQAKVYWSKTLQLAPKHFGGLLSLSERLLTENKSADAVAFAQRAVDAEPSSWRGHATLANAYLQQGTPGDAIPEAERALELGHQQAGHIEPLLANALARVGENERAIHILQEYLREHPADDAAKGHLASLQDPPQLPVETVTPPLRIATGPSPVPSTWLPPDVDENVPPVESSAACPIGEVIQKAGERVLEFVKNVDRFTATEFITHESINKWGGVYNTEKRSFDYLASISEIRPGWFSVDEYRKRGSAPVEFPDGVETRGLPSMSLLFHPEIVGNYEITCEGMARLSRGLAWQLHFSQRTDKPNVLRSYRDGSNGPSFPVALRGRAWIAADTYQVLRIETDLISPAPKIRLVTDRIAIEYGAVHFREKQVEMWLPLSADVYYDWKGRRAHRRHSFSNYLLFSVDDKQQISKPSAAAQLPAKAASD
jgi:tetratricopeptide (TPR) repeat protein